MGIAKPKNTGKKITAKGTAASKNITLKTGRRQNTTIDTAKVQAAVFLISHGIKDVILTSASKSGVFALSDGRSVTVKKANKSGKRMENAVSLTASPQSSRAVKVSVTTPSLGTVRNAKTNSLGKTTRKRKNK